MNSTQKQTETQLSEVRFLENRQDHSTLVQLTETSLLGNRLRTVKRFSDFLSEAGFTICC